MIAVYIVAGIILFFTLLLNIPIVVRLTFNNEFYRVKVGTLILQFPLLPKKNKKFNYKKVYKKIKDKKLSSYGKGTKKKTTKKKEKSFMDQIKEIIKDRDNISFLFEAILELLKNYSKKFKKHLHIKVYEILLSIGSGEPDKVCVACGAIYPGIISAFKILDEFSRLKITDANKISVAPYFNENKTLYSIDVGLRIRLICLLTPALKTLIKLFKKFILKG